MNAAYCPGLPDDPYPCGRILLDDDRAGLCIDCELRGEATHGITITTAILEARQEASDATP